MSYIKVELNNEHFKRVDTLCENMPAWRLSYRGEEANPVGVLGEIIVEDWLRGLNTPFVDERDQTTHDYSFVNGDTFEVKTKDRTKAPLDYYVATAPAYNHQHQKPNLYIFVSLLRPKGSSQKNVRNFTHAYIVGSCTREHFEAHSIFREKGYEDGSNKLPIKFDCFNILLNEIALPNIFVKNYLAPNSREGGLVT
ncbi:hypothetical protein ESZ36_17040 [Colwellia demingiae]|uniref:Uncharacterized protein n=1 Tax=Colwellia demingiae TaxID=89401 RepID=A0A5C6QA32_9GAMM|nr:hypothetical protein [Colwellia demingiae]TWX65512.1 hypothetical protein ESZ36_17040 [Colwellia demingiae]